MIKMLYFPVIAIMLVFGFILSLMISFRDEHVPLLYLSDFNTQDDFYTVLDVETGDTLNFRRPPNFKSIQYYGEFPTSEREDITSPYDDTVQFVLTRDYQAPNREEIEQLYRVRAGDQLEPVLSGENIYIWQIEFTDNGRFVYIFKKSESGIQHVLYTIYRYDIHSIELEEVVGDVAGVGLNCQDSWCQIISGMPASPDRSQTLFVLHKNSGELRQVEVADDITIHRWWKQDELLYTVYQGDGQASIRTYNIASNQYHNLAEIEGQGIANIYRIKRENRQTDSPASHPDENWLMVVANSPEDDQTYDIYIVNDLPHATTYPLGIQTSNAHWLFYAVGSDGSVLLTTLAPHNDSTNNVYIIKNAVDYPRVDQLTNADFDAIDLHDAHMETFFDDTQLLRMKVSDTEWRYYTIHLPTHTITQLANFNNNQRIVQTQLAANKKWLAVSLQEAGKYYLGIVSLDGSQPLRIWDVGTESYVCLLAWYAPDSTPPPCSLYFGIG